MDSGCAVRIRFCPPATALAHYFTSFYLLEVAVADGGRVTDHLHPEWASLRFHDGDCPDASNPSGNPLGSAISGTDFSATGPSARSVRFTIGGGRMWGLGLLPLGWAKFVGSPAADFADGVFDGHAHPAFAPFRTLAATLFGDGPDPEAELARINAHFLARLDRPVADEARIKAIHRALFDPETASVAQLSERAGMSGRTVERLCVRHFGFSPRMLLRRQRFMRSVATFMLDPSLKWIGSLDGHYHDQAQFVRDFRQFIGMTPRQYGTMAHPIMQAVVQTRAQVAGAAVQTLDSPEGARITLPY